MRKLIVIGDIHGRDIWNNIVDHENPSKGDTVVFMGDYWDSYDIPAWKQTLNFQQIVEFKEHSDAEVIMLYGNHEHSYLGNDPVGYTGHQYEIASQIKEELVFLRRTGFIQMAFSYDDLLFTHAGVSSKWLQKHLPQTTMETLVSDLNELFKTKLSAFDFAGLDPYGDSQESSPIWIRQISLLRSNKSETIRKHFRQVFGHTPMDDLNLETYKKYLGGRYIPVDALDNGQYLIYENGELSVGSVEVE